jgi:hypothetical protein
MPIRSRSAADRRTFLTTAGGTMTVLAATGAPNVIAQPKVQWRMPTAWPASLLQQTTALRLAQVVEEMSGGRFRIDVFPAGQLALPFDLFEAASKGEIQAFMASPQYWQNRDPAFEWFGTIPFGMNPQGMTAWLYQGDGLKLWEECGGESFAASKGCLDGRGPVEQGDRLMRSTQAALRGRCLGHVPSCPQSTRHLGSHSRTLDALLLPMNKSIHRLQELRRRDSFHVAQLPRRALSLARGALLPYILGVIHCGASFTSTSHAPSCTARRGVAPGCVADDRVRLPGHVERRARSCRCTR